MLNPFFKVALEKICPSRTLVTRTVPYAEYAIVFPPPCCLPRFLITLFFSKNGTYHAPANNVSHCFTSHYFNLKSAASPGDNFSLFPPAYKLVLEACILKSICSTTRHHGPQLWPASQPWLLLGPGSQWHGFVVPSLSCIDSSGPISLRLSTCYSRQSPV